MANARVGRPGVAVLALTGMLLSMSAGAIVKQGDAGARGGAATSAATPATGVNRDGFVQAIDPAAQSIVINSTKYLISTAQVALVDKRPKPAGLLSLATLKAGMYVRYRVAAEGASQRVVELWVMRDPQQPGTRP